MRKQNLCKYALLYFACLLVSCTTVQAQEFDLDYYNLEWRVHRHLDVMFQVTHKSNLLVFESRKYREIRSLEELGRYWCLKGVIGNATLEQMTRALDSYSYWRQTMLAFAWKTERRGKTIYLYTGSRNFVEACLGWQKKDQIVQVEVREGEGDYWGWEEGPDKYCFIWLSLSQVSICFAEGAKAAEASGKGRAVNLIIEEV